MLEPFIAIIAKDWKIIMRKKANLVATIMFAVTVLLIFHFAVPAGKVSDFSSGIYWVAFLFSGIIWLEQTVELETENDCFEALLMAPVSRTLLLAAKISSNLLFVILVQAIFIPLFAVFFDETFFSIFPGLAGLVFLTGLGFITLGTLLSILTAGIRSSEVLLPLLLFPLSIPLFLGSIRITDALIAGEAFSQYADWLKLMGAFDLIFMAVAFVTFELAMDQT